MLTCSRQQTERQFPEKVVLRTRAAYDGAHVVRAEPEARVHARPDRRWGQAGHEGASAVRLGLFLFRTSHSSHPDLMCIPSIEGMGHRHCMFYSGHRLFYSLQDRFGWTALKKAAELENVEALS